MYVYKIIHILQEYTHTKTYTSPNLKGCFQEVEEMEQQMTSSKQSEGGKRKKKDKTGWQKKKKKKATSNGKNIAVKCRELWVQMLTALY